MEQYYCSRQRIKGFQTSFSNGFLTQAVLGQFFNFIFIFKATPLGRSRAKPLGGIVLELDLQVERQK